MKKEKKEDHVSVVTSEKPQRVRRKGASAATNESIMKSEQRNSEHSHQKPAR